jgi:hypothetical protein
MRPVLGSGSKGLLPKIITKIEKIEKKLKIKIPKL